LVKKIVVGSDWNERIEIIINEASTGEEAKYGCACSSKAFSKT
jgi:hypothetical protein